MHRRESINWTPLVFLFVYVALIIVLKNLHSRNKKPQIAHAHSVPFLLTYVYMCTATYVGGLNIREITGIRSPPPPIQFTHTAVLKPTQRLKPTSNLQTHIYRHRTESKCNKLHSRAITYVSAFIQCPSVY
jgi:hypothetical protein